MKCLFLFILIILTACKEVRRIDSPPYFKSPLPVPVNIIDLNDYSISLNDAIPSKEKEVVLKIIGPPVEFMSISLSCSEDHWESFKPISLRQLVMGENVLFLKLKNNTIVSECLLISIFRENAIEDSEAGFFLASSGGDNNLWKTLATSVSTINLNSSQSFRGNLFYLDNSLYLQGSLNGKWEPFKYDFLNNAFYNYQEINTSASSNSSNFTLHNNEVYFSAFNENFGHELYKLSSQGPELVLDTLEGTIQGGLKEDIFFKSLSISDRLLFLSYQVSVDPFFFLGLSNNPYILSPQLLSFQDNFLTNISSREEFICLNNPIFYPQFCNFNGSDIEGNGFVYTEETIEELLPFSYNGRFYYISKTPLSFSGSLFFRWKIYEGLGSVKKVIYAKDSDVNPFILDSFSLFKDKLYFIQNTNSFFQLMEYNISNQEIIPLRSNISQIFNWNQQFLYLYEYNGDSPGFYKYDGESFFFIKRLFINGKIVSSKKEMFIMGSEDFGYNLWKSDGTTEGTVEIKNFSSLGSIIKLETTINGNLIFIVYNSELGIEPWVSNGTATGTSILKDINIGAGSSIDTSYGFKKVKLPEIDP